MTAWPLHSTDAGVTPERLLRASNSAALEASREGYRALTILILQE